MRPPRCCTACLGRGRASAHPHVRILPVGSGERCSGGPPVVTGVCSYAHGRLGKSSLFWLAGAQLKVCTF